MRKTLGLLAALVLTCAGAPLGWAQLAGGTAPAAPALKVGEVTIRFVGTATVSEQVVRGSLQLREGMDYDPNIIDRDVKALERTQLFDQISIIVGTQVGDRIPITFDLTPRYRVLAIRFNGNDRVDVGTLERATRSRPNLALNDFQVKSDTDAIRTHYQKAGFNQVQVTSDVERDRATGYANITFTIKEGPKARIGEVRFSGNKTLSNRELRKIFTTKKYNIFTSWASETGRFKDDVFEEDLIKLRDYYREKGFLDIEIPPERVEYLYPKPERLEIVIGVEEGVQYRVGDITFSGNTIHPTNLLQRLVRQRKGSVFTNSLLEQDITRIEDFYAAAGYLDTRVDLQRKPNLGTGAIDIEYAVRESEKFQVESIQISGNIKTKSTVILRELNLSPGDVFNTLYMKSSRARLENTKFFETVELTPDATNLPGRRDLDIKVTEGQTGSLTFGAGFNSVDKTTLQIEVAQSNFDLFNRRAGFQGAGQKFRVKLQVGDQSTEAVISFEEPWLFQQQLGLGFSIYRSTASYDTVLYREVRQGMETYLRKMIFPAQWVEGQATYTLETVTLDQVDPTASIAIQQAAGSRKISRLNLRLLTDRRDRLITTTQGFRAELSGTLAGGPLLGDSDYYSLEFRGSNYIPVAIAQKQVLEFITRAGVIDSYGRSPTVNYNERFFLGGSDDLRGFDFREVGPVDAFGQPQGGQTYALFSTEYTIDLVGGIRFAAFYDAGYLNARPFDFNPAEFNDNYGIGVRLFLAGAPLRLDYAWPSTSTKLNNKGSQFHFSFGTRF